MWLTREVYESWERQHLAPYATPSGASRGREHQEEEHPYRTAFQRDRDRIVHTTAWRRLEYKTQVFVNHEGDYYRTRLTHTIETAQVARTVARALQVNEDLAEAIACAHDLGHPPFGHAGETALQAMMSDHGGFEHNLQNLRIVEHLEERYPGFRGLNLTWEVREGMIKHKDDFHIPQAAAYAPELMPSLEAQIARIADDIAYNSHDLDDGLRSGLIEPEDLEGITLWRDAVAATKAIAATAEPDLLRHQRVRHVINAQVTDLVVATGERLASLRVASQDDVRKAGRLLATFSPEMETKQQELKAFLNDHLYNHYRVTRMALKAQRVVKELFQAYSEDLRQLPPSARRWIDAEGPMRVVCDYIAGMTDRFALQEHAKLFDPRERV